MRPDEVSVEPGGDFVANYEKKKYQRVLGDYQTKGDIDTSWHLTGVRKGREIHESSENKVNLTST